MNILDVLRKAATPSKEVRYPYALFDPTERKEVPGIIKFAKLKSTDVFMDLGCGDGRLLIEAARQSNCRCIGIDVNGKLVRKAIRNVKNAGLAKKISIRSGNIFECDISEATVWYTFLYHWMPHLIPILNKYPKRRIITNSWRFSSQGIEIEPIRRYEDFYEYRTPLPELFLHTPTNHYNGNMGITRKEIKRMMSDD